MKKHLDSIPARRWCSTPFVNRPFDELCRLTLGFDRRLELSNADFARGKLASSSDRRCVSPIRQSAMMLLCDMDLLQE